MKPYYQGKYLLKIARWQIRRAFVAMRWGSKAFSKTPSVFANVMPKSGSHLINQILQGLTNLGPFVNPGFPPVNRFEDNNHLSKEEVLSGIRRMRCGDVRYGYLHADVQFVSLLTEPERATLFLYRDPRDMLVSHVFYATEMHKGHGMYEYYKDVLMSMEKRLNAAIEGVNEAGFQLSNVRARYDAYLGWLDQPAVHCLKFEDLILKSNQTLDGILDYLETRNFVLSIPRNRAVELLKDAIIPQKSGTFRRGEPGTWKEYFSEENKDRFKKISGDLLHILDYEVDGSW